MRGVAKLSQRLQHSRCMSVPWDYHRSSTSNFRYAHPYLSRNACHMSHVVESNGVRGLTYRHFVMRGASFPSSATSHFVERDEAGAEHRLSSSHPFPKYIRSQKIHYSLAINSLELLGFHRKFVERSLSLFLQMFYPSYFDSSYFFQSRICQMKQSYF